MRPRLGSRLVRATAMGIVLVLVSCSSPTTSEAPEEEQVITVFGPWRGSAAANFRAVLAPFEERTGIRVRYVGTADFASEIVSRAENRQPPDIAVFPQPGLMAALADVGYVLPAPSDVVERSTAAFRPEMLQASTRFGDLIGLPIRQNVKSLVWYRPDLFEEHGYTVPVGWSEFQALIDRMIGDGLTPWCFGVKASHLRRRPRLVIEHHLNRPRLQDGVRAG